MSGLDLGTLGSCHRRDLVTEMRKARISGSDKQQSIETTQRANRANLADRLRATIDVWSARVRGYRVIQKGN